jgi:predicted Ser/Thr protein kinase
MPLVTKCPHCSKPSQIPETYAGRQVRCPTCKQIFVAQSAPAPQLTPVPQPVAAAARDTAQRATTDRPKGTDQMVRAQPTQPMQAVPSLGKSRPPAPKPAAPPTAQIPAAARCPACKAPLNPGATLCLDCGWVQPETTAADSDEQPVLCTNPACGVANPPTERYCQRCNTMLPTAAGTMLHGRYQIEKLLAIGGFGAVYLAKDVKANRQVAIKDMICADAQEFTIRLNFFRREAEILRSLESQAIVPKVYDFIHQGQSAHLVMEYIRGDNLLKILEVNSNKPFPVDLVVEWSKQICDVLQHMHSQTPPVVHRDLKPDNIMLLEDGRSIKLIDFGTARDIGRSLKTRLAAKTRVYTEGYAPPEQIIGKPEARSDLFALAGTMYHLITGKSPEGFYTARELEATLKEGNGAIPVDQRWFYELIRINLAEDANDRYFSARDIKFDLEQRRVTTEVACFQCRHLNKVREPYCARCAAPLTELTPHCHQCGKPNRMGSRCCIHCGNRLR